ncbi:MAG: HEPN domain-containing protein [Spirochaetaceae bacterium]|jgi:HEPN domain-containing protein|nr:HEPN domain-containing protein [Spirochaetaceae bacterium]
MGNDYKTWLDRAKSSLAISKIKLDENIFFEDLCFQAQQAVEKAIKGLLVFYNVDPEKTHNLVLLIKELSKIIEIPEEINETAILNNYAVQTRYPGDYTPVGEEEYINAITVAENGIKWIDKKIKEQLKKAEEENQQPYLDNIK